MIQKSRDKWRIGAVSFLNTWPLIVGLDDHPQVELTRDSPARLADQMEEGRLDVALIPIIDYFRLTAEARERHRFRPLVIVPNIGIVSDGPVASVRLYCRTDYPLIRHVALDPNSHTSNLLVRLILNDVYEIQPHYRWPGPEPYGLDQECDAFLLIGDRALAHDPPGIYHHVLDLGEAWRRCKHRPFVYAAWCAREADDLDRLTELLTAAKERGLRDRDRLAHEAAERKGLDEAKARHYFYENIRYDLTPEALLGLDLFYQWAAREDMAPQHVGVRIHDGPAHAGKAGS